ncbi:family 10 glycosylhydrolase [Nocardioides sp.]|uniref:family 10 glycosylhydrolase n=1 Tax=Nocardioides sp. TaxID=35761 RepID=UPI0019BBBFA3|nr:family 10 glycosylhydrolase [Nocardioides sp.]MBC7279660.1 family 10 glycosylhydrolase [Nocardioides sp.]
MRRFLFAVVSAVALIGAMMAPASPGAAAETDPPEQWRSLWVDGFNRGIYTPAQVDELVQVAEDMHVNALIVQTARRWDCFCNDALYPRTDAAIDPAPYDPLQEIITEAHAAGIEVHAWVNVNTMWNSATAPRSPEHAFNQHGPTATGDERWLNKKYDGTERVGANAYADPGHPGVVDYIVEGVQSIVQNYDVDGINLDYVRYPDGSSTTTHSDWGYNDVAVARFQAATGRTDVPVPADAQWSQWRRDQVTGLVRKIYLGLWSVDPSARLSMDAITYGNGPQAVGGWTKTRTYAEVLQDWKGWLSEGIMDTAVTMNYKRDWLPAQATMYDEWSEFLADNQGGRQAVNGPALYLNSVSDSVAQAWQAVTPSAAGNQGAGWSGYAYANPTREALADPSKRPAELAALTAALAGPGGPFEAPAVVPDMPWKSAPTDGHVAGVARLADGTVLDQTAVTLRPLDRPGPSLSARADGSGWFGFVHVPPGLYQVRIAVPEGADQRPVDVVRVRAGGIAAASFS